MLDYIHLQQTGKFGRTKQIFFTHGSRNVILWCGDVVNYNRVKILALPIIIMGRDCKTGGLVVNFENKILLEYRISAAGILFYEGYILVRPSGPPNLLKKALGLAVFTNTMEKSGAGPAIR